MASSQFSPVFSNTLQSMFSVEVRDHVVHSYRITGKIIVLYRANPWYNGEDLAV
jgi:hypothetical protein